jgi:peptidoglycan hydrolase-like protein with peptidoglycan-binding domain
MTNISKKVFYPNTTENLSSAQISEYGARNGKTTPVLQDRLNLCNNCGKKVFYLLFLFSLLVFVSGNFGQGGFLGVKKAFGYGGSSGSFRAPVQVPAPAIIVSPVPTPSLLISPQISPSLGGPASPGVSQGGQVLGVSTYRFTGKLGYGSKGDGVRELQKVLKDLKLYDGKIDGIFGKITLSSVKNFQAKNSLKQLGFLGPQTRALLNDYLSGGNLSSNGQVLGMSTIKFNRNLIQSSGGDDVTKLQNILAKLGFYTSMIDGDFGPKTKEAVKKFQAANALLSDGIVGPKTIEILNK